MKDTFVSKDWESLKGIAKILFFSISFFWFKELHIHASKELNVHLSDKTDQVNRRHDIVFDFT